MKPHRKISQIRAELGRCLQICGTYRPYALYLYPRDYAEYLRCHGKPEYEGIQIKQVAA